MLKAPDFRPDDAVSNHPAGILRVPNGKSAISGPPASGRDPINRIDGIASLFRGRGVRDMGQGDQAIVRLSRESESWKSIELSTVQEFTNLLGSDDKNTYQKAVYKERYIETALGQRYDRMVTLAPGHPERLAEYYCDGSKCADVSFGGGPGATQTQVLIKRSFKDEAQVGVNFRPIPLRYIYHTGNAPISQALRGAEALGTGVQLGRACDEFLLHRFPFGANHPDLVYTLDHATGIPLKLVGYRDDTAYAASRPSWRWEALAVDVVQGRLFPTRSEEVVFVPQPDGKDAQSRDRSSEVAFRTTHVVETLKFDADYPKTTFWPVIAPEANVMNSITHSIIPAKVKPVAQSSTPVPNPIRAEPPRDGWPIASVAGLAVGAALLLAGLAARRRSLVRAASSGPFSDRSEGRRI